MLAYFDDDDHDDDDYDDNIDDDDDDDDDDIDSVAKVAPQGNCKKEKRVCYVLSMSEGTFFVKVLKVVKVTDKAKREYCCCCCSRMV